MASENDFYKKILKAIAKVDEVRRSRKLKDLLSAGHHFLGKIKSIKIAGQGIDFVESDSKEIDYQEDLMNLLLGIELDEDRQLVLLIDEFPQTIQNIVDAGKGDVTAARQFLQSVRALRLDPVINGKVRFVFTGSVGLNYTVAEINCSAFVNDLNSIEVAALDRGDARLLLNKLLKHKNLSIKPELAEHLIQARNNNHFDHYYSRLKRRFKGTSFVLQTNYLRSFRRKGF